MQGMEEKNRVWSDLCAPYLSLQHFLRPAGWEMGEHSHSFYQLIYVTRGCLQVEYGQRLYPLSRGQAHILPPGFTHQLSSPEGYAQWGLDVESVAEAREIFVLLQDYFPEPQVISCPEALKYIEGLASLPTAPGRVERARLMTRLDSLILCLLEAGSRKDGQGFEERLCAYLDGHLGQGETLEEIAAAFFISPAQLERMAHRHFGCGVMEVRGRRREAEARALLLSGTLSIADIAEQLGFCDAAHFCHFFKKRCGVSPGNYRRMAQERDEVPRGGMDKEALRKKK